MHELDFLQDLTIVLCVASFVTVLFHRLRIPAVLGYLIAGFLIGPSSLPFPSLSNEANVRSLADLGIIFLMFSLGLEFHLKRLRDVGLPVVIAGLTEILGMFWAGNAVGRLFGWTPVDSLFLGAIVSISSTSIIVKTLRELGKNRERFSQLIFGTLVIEDILGIVMIALLSMVASRGTITPLLAVDVLVRLGLFLVSVFVVGLLVVPKLLDWVGKFRNSEVLLVTVLGLCFGMSLLAAKLNFSMALGAFVVGALVAESKLALPAEMLTRPIRDLFGAVFFVAVGMMIDPGVIARQWGIITLLAAVVIVGKVTMVSLATILAGTERATALRVGLGMAQIGEFGFIIASLGAARGVTGAQLYPVAVAVSGITTVFTPFLIRNSDAVLRGFDKHAPPFLLQWIDTYSAWVQRLRDRSGEMLPNPRLRKELFQVGLNVALMATILIIGAVLAHSSVLRGARMPRWLGRPSSWAWLACMLLVLPFLVITLRKVRVIAALVAESAVSDLQHDPARPVVARIIRLTINAAGIVALVLFILGTSSAFLPPLRVLVVMGLVLAFVGVWRYQQFVEMYGKAKTSLRQAVSSNAHIHPVEGTHGKGVRLPGNALVVPWEISSSSHVLGRMLKDLELRPLTGASIVSIERGPDHLVNPGAEEILLEGDKLFLFGSAEQVRQAVKYLN